MPVVLHVAFKSTENHYARGNVLLIGKWLMFFCNGENSLEHFSQEEHERHCCALTLSCPVKCMLCNSFCSAGDHFHALEATSVHLCG